MRLIIDQDTIASWLENQLLHSSTEPKELFYDGQEIPWATTKKFFSTFSYPSLLELHLINVGTEANPCCLTNLLKDLKIETLSITHCLVKSLSSLKKTQLKCLVLDGVRVLAEPAKLVLPRGCQELSIRNTNHIKLAARKSLKEFHVYSSKLEAFQPEDYPGLRSFSWCHTPMKSLDLKHWPKLQTLTVVDASLSELILPDLHPVKHLDLTCNSLKRLNLTTVYELLSVNVHSNKLEMLAGTENNKRLVHIECSCNKIGNLVVRGLTDLASLKCTRNKLRELDLSETNSLKEISHDDDVYVILY